MKIVEKPKDEIINKTKNYIVTTSNNDDGSVTKIKVNNRYVGNILNVDSNCKFSVIDNIQYAYSYNEQEFKENINALLKNSKIAVLIQTNHIPTIEFLQEHYEVYSLVKLPIGYNNGYQYHITLRNKLTNADNFKYARNIKQVSIKDIDSLDKEIIQLFKDKRIKIDIVPEIIKLIKGKI